MESWTNLVIIGVGLLIATALIRTVMGTIVRYAIFLLFSAWMYQQQSQLQGWDWIDVEMAKDLATIAAISLVFTMGIIFAFFRKSGLKLVLLPLIGAVMTFGVTAVWIAEVQ